MLRLVLLALLPAFLAACANDGYEHLTYEPSAAAYYGGASPYAGASAPYIAPAPGSYCEEAVLEAQDAAARAASTGTPLDAGRARRTAHYARRDCR